MRTLKVRQPHDYLVSIGFDLEIPQAPGPRALIYDRAVEEYAHSVADKLFISSRLGLSGGEGAKSITSYADVLSWLAKRSLPRDTTLYVVGGGTLTDLGGFVAASYLRGIKYVSIPTTTLAIVDASVGSKTGINLPEGKNLVGAFHTPEAVLADLSTLKTLPLPAFRDGLVEAFKHGIIAGDQSLLMLDGLSLDWSGFENYLARAISVKVRIVESDPRERGERRKLNLGHTLGHALEQASQHRLPHGAAVAYGLLYAALLGKALGGNDLLPLVKQLLDWLAPSGPPKLEWSELTPYLMRDKKKIGTALNWVVPMDLGWLEVQPVSEDILWNCYDEFLFLTKDPTAWPQQNLKDKQKS
jgi:3-dehydroquinate synthase